MCKSDGADVTAVVLGMSPNGTADVDELGKRVVFDAASETTAFGLTDG